MADPAHPSPGWYPDPTKRSRLRLFDGRSWTSETRDAPASPGGAPHPRRSVDEVLPDLDLTGPDQQPGSRGPDASVPGPSHGAAGAVLAVLVVVFLIAGLYEVGHASTGRKAERSAFAADSSVATTDPVLAPADSAQIPPGGGPRPGCDGVGMPSAAAVARWFAHSGLPVGVITSSSSDAAAASGGVSVGAAGGHPPCTVASFTDARAGGPNSVTVFAGAADATTAAAASGGVTIKLGSVIVTLDRMLGPYTESYSAQLHTLLGDG